MRAHLETLYNCTFLAYGEASDDGPLFVAVKNGRTLVAESVALMVSALSECRAPSVGGSHLRLAA